MEKRPEPAAVDVGKRGGIILVTGPARSGKSEWAEQLAQASGQGVVYIATARRDATNREWSDRLEQHRRRRPAHWQTQEVPTALAAAIAQGAPHTCLLIDSLGTWVANLLEQEPAPWRQTCTDLLTHLQRFRDSAQGTVILVAEETGWGVVPAYPLGRQFRDRLGHLTRQIGAIAQATYLVTAGYALNLNQLGQPVTRPD